MDFVEGFQIPTIAIGFQNPSNVRFQNPPIPNAMAYQTRDWNGFEIQIFPIQIHSRKTNALLGCVRVAGMDWNGMDLDFKFNS